MMEWEPLGMSGMNMHENDRRWSASPQFCPSILGEPLGFDQRCLSNHQNSAIVALSVGTISTSLVGKPGFLDHLFFTMSRRFLMSTLLTCTVLSICAMKIGMAHCGCTCVRIVGAVWLVNTSGHISDLTHLRKMTTMRCLESLPKEESKGENVLAFARVKSQHCRRSHCRHRGRHSC